MKSKQQKQLEAKARQEEYNKLTFREKLLKLDLQVGDDGALLQRGKIALKTLREIETGAIAVGVGDSIQKKKPYQKPKKS